MGLAFGSGPCNVACLPYLGPVFLGRNGGIRGAWRTVLPFSAGRVTGYTLLGVVAGTAGEAVTARLEGGAAALTLGAATVIAGLALLWRARAASSCTSRQGPTDARTVTFSRPGASEDAPVPREAHGGHRGPARMEDYQEGVRNSLPTALFGMGAAMALNPCMPLATVLLAAGATASWSAGGLLGLGFGVGAVVVPSLLFTLVVAHVGGQIRERLTHWEKGLTRAAAGMLVLMGVSTALGWIAP